MSLLPPPDARRLARAIARLPALERDVLMLCARDGLTPAEAAVRLGLPLAAAHRHLADALCTLDRALARPLPWWRRR